MGEYIMVDNMYDDYEKIVRKEFEEFFYEKKEQELTKQLVELYKKKNDLDVEIFNTKAELEVISKSLKEIRMKNTDDMESER